MRKLLFGIALMLCAAMTSMAQNEKKVVKEEHKVKHTSTVPQKVHNTFSKKKHYSGKKVVNKKEVENK
jgi:hypothetical protein